MLLVKMFEKRFIVMHFTTFSDWLNVLLILQSLLQMFDSLFQLSLRQLHLWHHHIVLLFALEALNLLPMQLGKQFFANGLLAGTHRFHDLLGSERIQRLLSVRGKATRCARFAFLIIGRSLRVVLLRFLTNLVIRNVWRGFLARYLS